MQSLIPTSSNSNVLISYKQLQLIRRVNIIIGLINAQLTKAINLIKYDNSAVSRRN